MLDGFCARSGEQVIERFRTQKTGVLLAFLACYPERRHTRESLGDLLWPDVSPERTRQRLSQALVSLRPLLEPEAALKGRVLLADRATVGLSPHCISSDAGDFRQAIAAAESVRDRSAQIALLEKALTLYSGDLLPGYFEDWVVAERQRLRDLYLGALRRLSACCEQSGDFDQAVTHARSALALEPLAEEFHRDLIRLLAEGGQKAAALRQAREMERTLAEADGELPSAATRALVEKIRSSETPDTIPVRTSGFRFSSLPVMLTRFFGREREIRQIDLLIRDDLVRLVTVTGGGGAGKTRLALETAGKLSGHFGGAVIFLPLVELGEIGTVQKALADQLSIAASAAPPLDEIVKVLGARPFLLILDNAEHLVSVVGPFVRDLLLRCSALTILVTSRQRLGLDGEREVPLPALSIPTTDDLSYLSAVDSVRLFVDRAQAVKPAFLVTERNAAAIASLCARLEGIPLAIELCAAWAQTLTPPQMLATLNQRFDLLVSRRADIPPRHRTLRAALEYSYLLLPEDLQRFFVRLSVFRGGWTLDAAKAVWGDLLTDRPPLAALTLLDELRERSLISSEESDTSEAEPGMRYRMLETLREFATEQRTMALQTVIGQRHADHYLRIAETAASQEAGPAHGAWLARLEAEHDNLRAALAWSLEQKSSEHGLRLAVALTPFWEVRGYIREAQDWLQRLLARSAAADAPVSPVIRAKALNSLAWLTSDTDFAAATAAAVEALSVWRTTDDARGTAAALVMLGRMAEFQAEDDAAQSYLEEGLNLAREAGDRSLMASALLNLGGIALSQERWQEAWTLTSECLTLLRTQGHRKQMADALNNLGLVARYQGDLSTARELLQENLAIRRELSNRIGTAIALLNLATVNRLEGRPAEARPSLHEAALLASDIGNRRVLAHCVKEMGHLACAERDYKTGLRLLALSETLKRALGMSFRPADPEELSRDTALLREALGPTAFDIAWARSDSLSPDEALSEALRLAGLVPDTKKVRENFTVPPNA